MDAALWRDLFHPDVSILEKIIRPILVYFFLIFGFRLAGKRELAQLNAFDLVVLLTISNTVQNAIIGNDNSVLGRSEEHTSELQSRSDLVCRLLLEKKKQISKSLRLP